MGIFNNENEWLLYKGFATQLFSELLKLNRDIFLEPACTETRSSSLCSLNKYFQDLNSNHISIEMFSFATSSHANKTDCKQWRLQEHLYKAILKNNRQ